MYGEYGFIKTTLNSQDNYNNDGGNDDVFMDINEYTHVSMSPLYIHTCVYAQKIEFSNQI